MRTLLSCLATLALGGALLTGLPRAFAQRDPSKAEMTADDAFRHVRGNWSLLGSETTGEQANGPDRHRHFVLQGERWSLRLNGDIIEAGKLRFDRRWDGPGLAFDMIINTGARRGQVTKAIMMVRRGKLYCAGSLPGESRPAEFSSEARRGETVAYTVWRTAADR